MNRFEQTQIISVVWAMIVLLSLQEERGETLFQHSFLEAMADPSPVKDESGNGDFDPLGVQPEDPQPFGEDPEKRSCDPNRAPWYFRPKPPA